MPTEADHDGRSVTLEFVTFHVALGTDKFVHPNQTLKHKEYLSMIDMMFASSQLFHPTGKNTVLTDVHTSIDGLSRRTNTVRFDINPAKLMLERAIAQLKHVQSSLNNNPMIILDSDILINASLLHIFRNYDFDAAITWRPNDVMPINGGLLILNNVRPEISTRFFNRFVDIYLEKYADQADWYGDQLALRDCVGIGSNDYAENKLIEVAGCRILLLSCDTYNFSPKNQFKAICSALSEKAVLHFKGERKRLMSPFWRGWLRPRGSYLPWVQLIGWRERRMLRRRAAIEAQLLRLSRDKKA